MTPINNFTKNSEPIIKNIKKYITTHELEFCCGPSVDASINRHIYSGQPSNDDSTNNVLKA